MELKSFPAEGIEVISLGNNENRFDGEVVSKFNRLLDSVENFEGAKVLLITGEGKFFSNGHNINYLEESIKNDGGKAKMDGAAVIFLKVFYRLLARIMTFPIPVIAAINGHAFAGGCLLAMACDYRIMNGEKGFICMNEIDMALAPKKENVETIIKPGMFPFVDKKMTIIMQSKLPKLLVRDMFLKGLRLTASEALKLGVIDEIAKKDILLEAVEFAKPIAAKSTFANRRTISTLKYEMVREEVRFLSDGDGVAIFRSVL